VYPHQPTMATLNNLKQALARSANVAAASEPNPQKPLTDEQYAAGFEAFVQGPSWATYRDFIIPELAYLFAPLHQSDALVSVLEIGPGSRSVIGYLPESLRSKICKYTAFEPNALFASKLGEWLDGEEDLGTMSKAPLVGLESDAIVYQTPFGLEDDAASAVDAEKYDIVLFCHSLYGMNSVIGRAQMIDMVVRGW
jgi:hypothetical protein